MRITIEFTLGFGETRKKIADDISKELYHWRRQIKEYKIGKKIFSQDFYKMQEDDILYQNIVDFAKRFPEEIALEIYEYYVEYTSEEIDRTVAFIPHFTNNYCEEYDDTSIEYNECKYCYACLREQKKKTYIMPKGFVKTKADAYGVLRVDTELDHFLVLPRLYEKLIEEGVPEKYFRPMFSKRHQILAYELISDNILPENSFCDENYYLQKVCTKCGSKKYEEDKNKHIYLTKSLSEEGVSALQEVNETTEYYHHQRVIIVNKNVHDIIKKYDSTARFYPVFLK